MFLQAIEKMKSNIEYKVKVVQVEAVNRGNFSKIPSISTYNNFQFEDNGIRVWKFYGIGRGEIKTKFSLFVIIDLL